MLKTRRTFIITTTTTTTTAYLQSHTRHRPHFTLEPPLLSAKSTTLSPMPLTMTMIATMKSMTDSV